MGHIISRDVPEDQLTWNSDIIRMTFESPVIRRAKGARLLSHCISITRMIFSNEMRTFDQLYFTQTVENFMTDAMTEINTNRDYLDIRNFILDAFYGRITYEDVTKEQINRFVEVYYGMLSDAVEKVRIKTEVWDYVAANEAAEAAGVEESDEEDAGIELTPEEYKAAMEAEGYETDPADYHGENVHERSEAAIDDPEGIPDEEDIAAMEAAVPDEVKTTEIHSAIGGESDIDENMN